MSQQHQYVKFDLSNFDWIEDIIFLDEPILSHLKHKNQNYFFYLAETTKVSDLHLLFKVSEDQIYRYLTSEISLKSLIINNDDFIYLINQDFNGSIISTDIQNPEGINEDYLPGDESFLKYSPSKNSYYYDMFEHFKHNYYLEKLKENAFYVKFTSRSPKHSDTIGLKDLSNFLLRGLSSSYSSFLDIDFFKTIGKYESDETKLKKLFRKLRPTLDLRLVDLQIGSFEIGLAYDHIMVEKSSNKFINQWIMEVDKKYRYFVLDEDLDDKVEDIVSTYNEEERRKIYSPIFNIIQNQNFDIQVKDSELKNYSRMRIGLKSYKRIITSPAHAEKESEDYQIINVTTVIDKNHPKKFIRLDRNTLFDTTNEFNANLEYKDFDEYGYSGIRRDINIPYTINSKGSNLIFRTVFGEEDFIIVEKTGNLEKGLKNLISKIYEFTLDKPEE